MMLEYDDVRIKRFQEIVEYVLSKNLYDTHYQKQPENPKFYSFYVSHEDPSGFVGVAELVTPDMIKPSSVDEEARKFAEEADRAIRKFYEELKIGAKTEL